MPDNPELNFQGSSLINSLGFSSRCNSLIALIKLERDLEEKRREISEELKKCAESRELVERELVDQATLRRKRELFITFETKDHARLIAHVVRDEHLPSKGKVSLHSPAS